MKNLQRWGLLALLCLGTGSALQSRAADKGAVPAEGLVLPFPAVPSASIAKPRLQHAVQQRRAARRTWSPARRRC
jgi:hypothetical protein